MDETTQLGTIWSQTLLDILCAAVRKGDEAAIRAALKEIKEKGYKRDEVRKYAAKNLEPRELALLDAAIGSKQRK